MSSGSTKAYAKSDAVAVGKGKHDSDAAVSVAHSHAVAVAKSGDRISARASANSNTKVRAVAGANPKVRGTAGRGGQLITQTSGHKSIVMAVSRDASYSIAIATRHKVRAFSGTLGKGVAVSVHAVKAAARTGASASAFANRSVASARAHAHAKAVGKTNHGKAYARSTSDAVASARRSAKLGAVSSPNTTTLQIAASRVCSQGISGRTASNTADKEKTSVSLRSGTCND